MKCSVDTGAILDGWRRYYPPDVFPDVWTGIEELIEKGELRATEEVLVELEKRGDDIFAWAKERKGACLPASTIESRRGYRSSSSGMRGWCATTAPGRTPS